MYNIKENLGDNMLTNRDLPDCPVKTTIDLIGNKWKLLIIREILNEPKRYNELYRLLDGISYKVLTDNLKQMEQDKIIIRKDYNENPPKVEYSLSSIGESLKPIINEMANWGESYKNE